MRQESCAHRVGLAWGAWPVQPGVCAPGRPGNRPTPIGPAPTHTRPDRADSAPGVPGLPERTGCTGSATGATRRAGRQHPAAREHPGRSRMPHAGSIRAATRHAGHRSGFGPATDARSALIGRPERLADTTGSTPGDRRVAPVWRGSTRAGRLPVHPHAGPTPGLQPLPLARTHCAELRREQPGITDHRS